MISDAQWLGILLTSESNEPHEWPAVGWVVRNRVEAPGRFGNTYPDTILQPKQFSFFNSAPKEEGLEAVYQWARGKYPGGRLLPAAEACATWLLSISSEHCPFPRTTYYYWSPVSMKPPGRMPSWAANLDRFTPQGLDPWRFVFASQAA